MLSTVVSNFIFQWFIVFARLSMALSLFPVFRENYILARGRLVIAIIMTFVIYPTVENLLPQYSNIFADNISIFLIELITGFIIAFASNCYFLALNIVGQIISMQSGLGSATFFDPSQRSQVALFTNLLSISTIVLILITDTHYLFIQSIIESYIKFPVGKLLPVEDMADFISHVVNDSFLLSFKISSPFLIISTVILVASAILARLMPNLQVFFVMTPAQILFLFITLYIVINTITDNIIIEIQNTLHLTL